MPRAKILYIEDNLATRQLVQLIFERRDHLALTMAVDGKSGIEAAKRQRPEVILLDLSLPDMSGYAVLAALRSDPLTAKIPVIAISGDFPPQHPAEPPYQFAKYLRKPIEIAPLYQAIDELLQR